MKTMTRDQALQLRVGERVREFGIGLGGHDAKVVANGTLVWVRFSNSGTLKTYSHDEIAAIFERAA